MFVFVGEGGWLGVPDALAIPGFKVGGLVEGICPPPLQLANNKAIKVIKMGIFTALITHIDG
jgi:hypothetical protein